MTGNSSDKNKRKVRNKKQKQVPVFSIILVSLFVIISASIFYVGMRDGPGRSQPVTQEETEPGTHDTVANPTPNDEPAAPTNIPMPPAVTVNGIYYLVEFSTRESIGRCIEIAETTSINAIVIDVKDDYGNLTFATENDLLRSASDKFATEYMRGDPITREDIANMKSHGIYTIARIVCFKDNPYAVLNPSNALQSVLGGPWLDADNIRWLDPYNKDNWEYILEFCKEAADIGFDEIQLDYVRFPLYGRLSDIDYGPGADEHNKYQIINEFVRYIREEMIKLGVRTSADIFGIVGMSYTDARDVGQNMQLLLGSLDSICPMIYPSHFGHVDGGSNANGIGQYINGILIERPNQEPYDVIYNTLQHYVRQINDFREENPDVTPAIIRPYLQNWTPQATYVGNDNFLEYGPDEIAAQIQAVYDAGFNEWILWTTNNSLDPSMIP